MWGRYLWRKFTIGFMMVAMLAQGGYIINNEYEMRAQRAAAPVIVQATESLRIINGEAYTSSTGVTVYMYTDLKRDLQYMKAHNINVLHLNQMSGGGGVFEMFGILNTLQAAIKDGLILHTHADGFIASAAVPVFLLGAVRTMGKNCYVMLHSHNVKQSEYAPETRNKMGLEWTKAYVQILLDRTTMGLEEIMKYLGDDKSTSGDQLWLSYEDAEARGFLTI